MSKTPKLCKQGNLAYVRIHGRKVYLGIYGTAEAQREYHRVIAEFHAHAAAPPRNKDSITLDEICLRFLEDKKTKVSTTQWDNYKNLVEILLTHYSGLPANEFSPNKLRTMQAEFVNLGYVRPQCNRRVNAVRAIFKWGVSRELVRENVWSALRSLEPIKKGESAAPEGKKRKAIPQEYIERTLAELSSTLAAMARIHLATAARPSEICLMRIEDIDRANPDLWVHRLEEHKTDWVENDCGKVIYLAKPEIAILTPIIGDRTEGYVFRPQDAVAEKHAKKWSQAKRQKKTPSRLKRDATRAKSPKIRLNECYSAVSYRKAIERACQRAGVPRWFPYALRHTGITKIGIEYGVEAAQHVAGHKDLRTTLNYFHGEDAVAKSVALKRNEQYKTDNLDAPATSIEPESEAPDEKPDEV
jgi:integrase